MDLVGRAANDFQNFGLEEKLFDTELGFWIGMRTAVKTVGRLVWAGGMPVDGMEWFGLYA